MYILYYKFTQHTRIVTDLIYLFLMAVEALRLEEKENDGLGIPGGDELMALSKACRQARRSCAGPELIDESFDGPFAVADSSSLVPRVSLQTFDLIASSRL